MIAYVSHSLRPTEWNLHNYSSFELELLALVWAITGKFAVYFMGAERKVFTDNNHLAYLEMAKLGALD